VISLADGHQRAPFRIRLRHGGGVVTTNLSSGRPDVLNPIRKSC
jgi:hypothetical protein